MTRPRNVVATLLIGLAMAVPGSTEVAKAAKKNLLRTAMLAPRNGVTHRTFKRMDKELGKATNGSWGVRMYPGGMAGDEKDMIRKMRVGQMDAAMLTTTGLTHVVRETVVLDTPGVIRGYRDLEAVEDAMFPEWQEMAWKSGFKLVGWWEAGRYRIFSNATINRVADLKKRRAWLWPMSFVLKEMWRVSGITGVPLGVPDVYGALQTGMINTLICSSAALVAMRWHTKLDHMTEDATGVLMLSWLVTKKTWDSIPKAGQESIEKWIVKSKPDYKKQARKEDKVAYKMLLKRGYKLIPETKERTDDFERMYAEVRKRLTGRVFSAQLLKRVQGIVGHK